MPSEMLFARLAKLVEIFSVVVLVAGMPAAAQQETVLYNIGGNINGGTVPLAGLVCDGIGNLYGTTSAGGTYQGAALELTPTAEGTWTEVVMHDFSNVGGDGYNPYAGLILDASGNLYGTTYNGGANGAGTIFDLQPTGNGNW